MRILNPDCVQSFQSILAVTDSLESAINWNTFVCFELKPNKAGTVLDCIHACTCMKYKEL